MTDNRDRDILRALAEKYMQIATAPVQQQRRQQWSCHYSLQTKRPPVIVSIGIWNKWARSVFGDDTMECSDPELKQYERFFKMSLFQNDIGDDTIIEPWLTVQPSNGDGWFGLWGIVSRQIPSDNPEGAWKYDPAIIDYADADQMQVPHHYIDEEQTQRWADKIEDIVGDIVPINRSRAPRCNGFAADLITIFCHLRGLEQVMIDMYENPEWLHKVMAFMRDGVLINQSEAEQAGDITLTCGDNQAMAYSNETEWPVANSGPRKLSDIWCFSAAQEMALVSPAQHEEFVLQYQLPIISRFKLVHYGCCENLTRKIDMLRQIPNLRSIGVTPSADVQKCAEQIKDDYAFSWRPNPTDMVCAAFEPDRIRSIVRQTLECTKGCHVHIDLKDIETLCGDLSRLKKWTDIVNSELDRAGF